MRGFFPAERLQEFRKIDGHLSGHAEMRYVPGVDMSTGSLGQGFSAAVGMALGAKLSGYSNTVYAVMGDGEIQEGQFWEACMYAGAHKLGNLIGIVDSNKIQLDGRVSEVLDTGDLQAKFEAFGFFVQSIDGHDVAAISDAIDRAKAETGRASMIIANTVKGKGVSFMENTCKWHGRVPTDEEFCCGFRRTVSAQSGIGGLNHGGKNCNQTCVRRSAGRDRQRSENRCAGRGRIELHDVVHVRTEVPGALFQYGYRRGQYDRCGRRSVHVRFYAVRPCVCHVYGGARL